jgi:3-dehydrosphinganine reductase
MDWRNLHSVVTGGSSGIGRALVDRLARRGGRVSVVALDDEDLERVASDHAHREGAVTVHAADVGDEAQVRAAIDEAVAAHGPCDLLITSAGITRPGRFLELPDGEFEREMSVNYFGTLHAIRAVAPSMMNRHTGTIVAISSAAGLLGVYGYSAYGASKYAVRGLCDVLRTEMKPHGVHVACTFPTDVDTPMFAGEQAYLPEETRAISGSITPISPEKVAGAVLRGVERRSVYIFADPSTRALDALVRIAPGTTRWWLDRKVARSRRASND